MQIIASYTELIVVYNSAAYTYLRANDFLSKLKDCMDKNFLP